MEIPLHRPHRPRSPRTSRASAASAARSDPGEQELIEKSPLFHIYQIGSEEIRHRLDKDNNRVQGLSGRSIQAIRASLDAGLVRESHRLTDGLVYLTISIAGGPYVGLLGTVVGVMITFAIIAKSGEVNVNSIAPGIASALLATVVGLVVAIPALFIYSYLNGRIKNSLALMQVFIDEFVAKMAEFYRPAVETESTPAAPATDRPLRSTDQLSTINFFPWPPADKQLRRHQRHPDGGPLSGAAADLHHHDHRRRAGREGESAQRRSKPASQKMDVPKTQAITIDTEGKIRLNTMPVTLAELETKLAARQGRHARTARRRPRRPRQPVPGRHGRARRVRARRHHPDRPRHPAEVKERRTSNAQHRTSNETSLPPHLPSTILDLRSLPMSPRPPFPPPPNKSGKHRVVIGILLAIVLLGGVVSFMMGGGKRHETCGEKE